MWCNTFLELAEIKAGGIQQFISVCSIGTYSLHKQCYHMEGQLVSSVFLSLKHTTTSSTKLLLTKRNSKKARMQSVRILQNIYKVHEEVRKWNLSSKYKSPKLIKQVQSARLSDGSKLEHYDCKRKVTGAKAKRLIQVNSSVVELWTLKQSLEKSFSDDNIRTLQLNKITF